ncbi:hypothetical protein ACFYY3_17570 [Streptomyces sp. NPDC001812]|uniref:Uncharacterized protein n=1 Tax=Streptomyces cathayae TaxID=3031124 RepID=A0ABY8K109_9ACTN|nr:hypothetical protein [Streptomyces sp. HUAS 5]WGD41343.1 hypothetical protein PYS65_14870 [Streptomyces sp. HUAS 5]
MGEVVADQHEAGGVAGVLVDDAAAAVRERVQEDQAAARLGFGRGRLKLGQAFAAGIGHLDAERAVDRVKHEAEIPAGDTAVRWKAAAC